jgi:hypothetical protein
MMPFPARRIIDTSVGGIHRLLSKAGRIETFVQGDLTKNSSWHEVGRKLEMRLFGVLGGFAIWKFRGAWSIHSVCSEQKP